jgi:hypothetical protein
MKNNREEYSEKIVREFRRIKSLGFVPSNRPRNLHGGIGNTFEDHLGVAENNFKDPDFEGFEVKSRRELNSSYTTLFSKSPSSPPKANNILKNRFGEVRDPNFPVLKKLYASIFGNRESLIYEKYKMRMVVDRENEKLILMVRNLEGEILFNDTYWTFEALKNACKKLKDLFVVYAEIRIIEGLHHYHYNSSSVYFEFSFDEFLTGIEDGRIMFDIRMGVHKNPEKANYGTTHDHGSGFRIQADKITEFYNDELTIE